MRKFSLGLATMQPLGPDNMADLLAPAVGLESHAEKDEIGKLRICARLNSI